MMRQSVVHGDKSRSGQSFFFFKEQKTPLGIIYLKKRKDKKERTSNATVLQKPPVIAFLRAEILPPPFRLCNTSRLLCFALPKAGLHSCVLLPQRNLAACCLSLVE